MIDLPGTSAVSDLMRADPRIENWIAGLDSADRVVTRTIVKGEILFVISRLPPGRRRTELEETGHRFLFSLRCESVPERAASIYADLKRTRQRRGISLDENDLRAAATALAPGAALVSRESDFKEIPGLALIALN